MKTSGWKFVADSAMAVHEGANLLFDVFVARYTQGTADVYKMALRDACATLASMAKDAAAKHYGGVLDDDGNVVMSLSEMGEVEGVLRGTLDSLATVTGTSDTAITFARAGIYQFQKLVGKRCAPKIGYYSKLGKRLAILSRLSTVLTLGDDLIQCIGAAKKLWKEAQEWTASVEGMRAVVNRLTRARITFERQAKDFNNYYLHCCVEPELHDKYYDPVLIRPLRSVYSIDPNEMGGIMGRGDEGTQRYVKPGEWMTYTVYFENKSTATAAAQEVKVTNPLSRYLDWSTFEMGEVAFNNQVDLGLNGQQNGTSEVTMNGTSYRVRSKVTLDKADGQVAWYLRIVDPSTATTWPDDVFAGFLPPNDETFRGEGHLTYRIKVRDDAPAGVKITNAASIVFDYNDPIETDPAWWNQVAKVVSVEGLDGKSVNVSVDPAWIKAHVGASATDAEIAAALNAVGKNGLKVWMSAALGLDPENPDDTFRVDVPQNADANVVAAKILGGDQPETNAWMAIQYRLDRDASGDGAVQPGVAQSGRAFGIDVGGAADPTGVYQVKAVFSDDEGTATTEVPAANQIGVLRTAAASAREIVPVPWTKFASEVTDIAVSNLVKTAGLSAGDRLFAYDESAKRYATWELRSDKTWKPLKTIKLVDGRLEAQEAESPEVATVKRGSGVWLERQDTAKPIVLVGQHEAASAVTAINGGTSDLPKWNLLAIPAISNWNLNAICEGVDVKDRIIVPTGKEPRIYTRDAANAKWGYMGYEANDKGIVKPVRKEDDTMLAPGTGFWYISEGGAPVITW